jgi:hypothetical protein
VVITRGNQRLCGHARRGEERRGDQLAGEFLDNDRQFRQACAAAAVPLRHGDAQQAELGELRPAGAARRCAIEVPGVCERHVLAHEGADHRTKVIVFGGHIVEYRRSHFVYIRAASVSVNTRVHKPDDRFPCISVCNYLLAASDRKCTEIRGVSRANTVARGNEVRAGRR